MKSVRNSFKTICSVLIIGIIASIFVNMNIGFLKLNFSDFFSETQNSQIAELRINRVLVMLLAGISIPTSGFLLQEYFQNPLAWTFGFGNYFSRKFECSILHILFTKLGASGVFAKQFFKYFRDCGKFAFDVGFIGIFKSVSR